VNEEVIGPHAESRVVDDVALDRVTAVDVTYYAGGKATVDGKEGERQENVRVGGTIAIPVNRYNSVKLYGSTGAVARVGGSFNALGIAWQYRWGGGL
jgi:hypothetical protein